MRKEENMKKKKLQILAFLAIVFVSLTHPGCQNKPVPVEIEEIEVTEILNLSALKPTFKVSSVLPNISAFEMDQDQNLYFCDTQNHRSLKYNKEGRFLKQIGQIGQVEDGLYYPIGLRVQNGKVYILNVEGKNLKTFDTEGRFISRIEFDNAYCAESMVKENDRFYVNIRYKDKENFNKQKLISIFSDNGAKKGSFVRVLQPARLYPFSEFNACYLEKENGKLYGAFKCYPVIFCYDLKDGREIYYRDLLKDGIAEFDALYQFGIDNGADLPHDLKMERGVKTVLYIKAFAAAPNGDVYLGLCLENNPTQAIVLRFDDKGILKKRLRLKWKGQSISFVGKIIFQAPGKRYVAGQLESGKDFHLFRF